MCRSYASNIGRTSVDVGQELEEAEMAVNSGTEIPYHVRPPVATSTQNEGLRVCSSRHEHRDPILLRRPIHECLEVEDDGHIICGQSRPPFGIQARLQRDEHRTVLHAHLKRDFIAICTQVSHSSAGEVGRGR